MTLQQLELFAAATTPEERQQRRAEARCCECNTDLTVDLDWFVWGPMGDIWCRACSAAVGVETGDVRMLLTGEGEHNAHS